MTSPIGNKPSQTVKDYETVHGQGSRFGQDLDEAKVRKLLSNKVSSPFSKAATNIVQTVNEVVNNIADSIRGGGGAKYGVIDDAVTDRLGPIDSAVSRTGEQFKELADRAKEIDKVQEGLIEDSQKALENAKNALNEAKDNREKLAEFNDRITDQVDTLTVTADNALAKADSLSEKQREILSEAEENRKVLDQAVLDLKEVSEDFADFRTLADKATEDVLAAKEAAERAGSDLEALDKAIKESVDIGASLVPLVPGTRTPVWATQPGIETVVGEANTPVAGMDVYTQGSASRAALRLPERYVKVSDSIRYKVSFWVKGSDELSGILLSMCTPSSISHPIIVGRVEGLTETVNHDPGLRLAYRNGWLIGVEGIDATWRRAEYTVKFKPGTEYVSFRQIWWSYGGGGSGVSQQWIADLRVEPQIPDQATIDRLQNNAILKNEIVGSTNATAIEVMNKAWETQRQVNENQEKWNKGAEDALVAIDKQQEYDLMFQEEQQKWNKTTETATSALNRAVNLLNKPELGSSLVPLAEPSSDALESSTSVSWTDPAWSTAPGLEKNAIDRPEGVGDAWFTQSTPVFNDIYDPVQVPELKVMPGVSYRVSFWAYSSVEGSSFYFQMVSQSREMAGESVKWVSGAEAPWSVHPVSAAELPEGWTYCERIVTFGAKVDTVRLLRLVSNDNQNALARHGIADLSITPDLPSQAEVDEAQDEAAKANRIATDLNTAFAAQQRKTNDMVQEQLWLHQDTIEYLDILDTKMLHYLNYADEANQTNPYASGSKWVKAATSYLTVYMEGKEAYVAFKGQWEGGAIISLNWTNGAMDQWTVPVSPDKRVYRFEGGAALIAIRGITVQVLVKNLRREAEVKVYKGNGGYDYLNKSGDPNLPVRHFNYTKDPNGLLRKNFVQWIRFKAPVTPSVGVYYRGEDGLRKWCGAGSVITEKRFYPEDQTHMSDGSIIKFTEAWQSEDGYTPDKTIPPSSSRVITRSA